MHWRDELAEAGERAVREARANVYQACNRLDRARADLYLEGVLWVVRHLRARHVQGREGPVVFVRWLVEDMARLPRSSDGLHDVPEELGEYWVKGRNFALRTINATKMALGQR